MKVLIIAPYWGQPGHVGVYRIDRFIRWFSSAGIEVVLVRAGSKNEISEKPWGKEITIEDPLKMFSDPKPGATVPVSNRKPNRLRRLFSFVIFNPDPTILWSKKVTNHNLVLSNCTGVEWVLSSSPPESPHIAAYTLASRFNSKLIVDMRDGWLDEPFKPLLCASRIQRWREGRLEKKILRYANLIMVTSVVWKELLINRLRISESKIVVLTNGCPIFYEREQKENSYMSRNKKLTLIHAGRFTGSRQTQKIQCMLEPLYSAIKNIPISGKLILLGNLEPQDYIEVAFWHKKFNEISWEIELISQVTRAALYPILSEADGLILLSISKAAIPSKLFEYLVIKKPILAITLHKSAVWQLKAKIPNMYVVDPKIPDSIQSINDFIEDCQEEEHDYIVPDEFCESSLSKIFLSALDID